MGVSRKQNSLKNIDDSFFKWVYLEVGDVASAVVLFAAGAVHSWMKFFLNLHD